MWLIYFIFLQYLGRQKPERRREKERARERERERERDEGEHKKRRPATDKQCNLWCSTEAVGCHAHAQWVTGPRHTGPYSSKECDCEFVTFVTIIKPFSYIDHFQFEFIHLSLTEL